jgi:hypothetical protein
MEPGNVILFIAVEKSHWCLSVYKKNHVIYILVHGADEKNI